MCGIAGFQGHAPLPEERIKACLAIMNLRGPDHQAARVWQKDGVYTALLHSRLSIIDLDPRANQPMGFAEKWISLNGEIYNFVERRQDLEAAGVALQTRSDTEVLLAALARFGWDVLDKCEGMWAFALYDETTGDLTLSRDRFGEKPLYVLSTNEGVYFGSEIKFIAALLGRRLTPNVDHLWRYLVNGYKALYKDGRNGFFEGVREVSAGANLTCRRGRIAGEAPYWTPAIAIDDGMTYEGAVKGARERLIRAVELRLRADVPLAFCMSGGVDSNALISIAKRVFGYDVHGFTIMNKDSRYEESDMIEIAVRELGVRHTPIPVATEGFLDGLRTLIRQHDAPIYTITYYAQWMLQKAIADAGYRISISGSAADELFSGYYDHHLAYLQEVQPDRAHHATSLAAWMQHIKPIVRNPHLGNPSLFIDDPSFRDHIFFEAETFAAYLTFPWQEAFAEESYSRNLLRNRMLNELFRETVPVILHEDDLNAMYYSIENRSPFLDRPLFEFCNSIPTRHLFRDGMAKAILRDSVRGIAPDAIVDNRRKVGFNAPVLDYLDVSDPAVRQYLFDDSPIYDYVRRAMIEDLTKLTDLPNSQSKFLFNFVNCKMFMEEFAA
ncbi:asparagine synthase (glutamine-hydrolyzing) [Bradyrhizobium sp. HKCCYLS2038]|uniref:asparagine synthase (glutamine-hydrolyzing) n=1 Tax=unclassified Bradyrhizobium TaxID=2631580 RepID=UPI003EBB9425